MAWFAEMRRRNVLKVALLYAVLSWLVAWFVSAIQSDVILPTWTETFTYFVLAIGFPVALWFAWTYEITPSGLKKAVDVDQTQSIVYKTGQKLNAAVAVLLVLGVLAVFGQRLLPKFEFLAPLIPEGRAPVSENAPPAIRSHTLDNGLRIIVWPDENASIVSMLTVVHAGGRDEFRGITGLSHLFGRLMSTGTTVDDPANFAYSLALAGATHEFDTNADVTVFTTLFERDSLEAIFEIEALRLQDLNLSPEIINTHRAIMLAERRAEIDSDNDRKLSEQVRAIAYLAHPYHSPVMGWASDIQSWNIRDIADFYASYYAPNNLTVVIAGNVTAKEVFGLADIHFGPMAPVATPRPMKIVEPEQAGTRRTTLQVDTSRPLLHLAFHSGDAADADALPMRLLLRILAAGGQARLHRLFVEDEALATSIEARLDERLDPGLVYVSATLAAGADVQHLENRILEELRRVTDEVVSDEELAAAKADLLADTHSARATIRGRARLLAEYEILRGNYELLFDLPDSIAAVTAEDLQQAAAATFDKRRMTVGVLLPLPAE